MSDTYLTPRRSRVGLVFKILGALVVLVILLVVGAVFALESIVNSKKDAELAKLSQQLGRPVKVGRISLSLRAGRVQVADVTIGRDPAIPEEPDPALSLGLARIEVPLWPIIRSKGKELRVKEVTVERFSAAVVRLPDGKLNWQKVAERLQTEPQKPSEPPDAEMRAKIRNAVIEKIRLDDLSVKLVDLGTQPRGATVEIRDLDVALDNVSLSNAFSTKITAAILAPAKNFDFEAKLAAAPELPDTIAPPRLEHVTLKLAPTALAPLAPFLAALDGATALREVLAGTVETDLDLAAGAAVPGGEGPTTFRGFVALAGLKFAGGESFDARIDSDVLAAMPAGTVDIKKLTLRLSDMGIDARGKLSDLGSDGQGEPRVDGFNVQSQGLDFTRLHGFYPALDKTAGVVLRGPFSFEARGAASEGDQRLTARLDLTGASIEVPGQFRKPSGTVLNFETQVTAKRNLIEVKRAALNFAKLTLQATASLRTEGSGKKARQSFVATADVPPMQVRDLVALVAPKELPNVPAVRFGARAEASGTIGQDETMKVKVPSFTLAGGKSDLQGQLSVENLVAPKVAFEGHSKYLDIDDFMPPSAKDKDKADAKKAGPAGKAAPAEPPPLLKATTGTVKLVVDRGRAAEIDYQALRADLGLDKGRLQAKTLEVDTFGGHFSGAGTELPLADPKTGFAARGDVSNVDLAAVLAQFAPEKKFMTGRLFAKIDLSGASTLPETIRNTLDGRLGGRVENAQLMAGSVLEPVVEALEKASTVPLFSNTLRSAKDKVAALKDKRLGKLGGALLFKDGGAQLSKPLEANTPSGPLSVTGGVTLAGEADMKGELGLSPAIATALTGGKARFDAPVPVALRIEGPLTKPRIRPSDPAALAKVFIAAFAKGEAGRFVQDKAKVVLENPAVVKAREDAERARAQASAEADKARAQATAEADRVKREAEERAQRAKEEAETKAKEAAKKGLRGILGK